ncbi:ROK family transcriptional regulator [Acuticoccus sp. MNP-M23]|uniref:ROK family transcriptional regulator n=1 Tax=Acuticoccus sp. MNP-M23 TaxID=3072793 RepID=UPI0028162BF0|nr:ROK family transcriptional regulator [Acuticoccus sp. MNP-M23]WMS44592.1 ROK family transcriptional regulator [Acuticoccus sp. MNP-M23]
MQQSPNRGSNQIAVRSYNERLILQLVRWHPGLTKSEAIRATGLSPNAVSVIFRSLEDAALIIRDAPIRGRIGQPSTPVRLNPDARLYAGLKIGRRSADLVLIDFVGTVRASVSSAYPFPTPDGIQAFAKSGIRQILKSARVPRDRVLGLGIAMPFEIWGWNAEIGVPQGTLDAWRDVKLTELLSRTVPWSIITANDATAACVAEMSFNMNGDTQDAIYLFVGTLIGGGVILNGSVFLGRTGNAGGFGPFRVPGGEPGADRLIDHASLTVLDQMLRDAGHDPASLRNDPDGWTAHPAIVEAWLDLAARGIAHAIASSLSIIDFETVVIDGSFPPDVRDTLVAKIRDTFSAMDRQGLSDPAIKAGHWGSIARAVGAAALPLNASFSIDQNTLMRS